MRKRIIHEQPIPADELRKIQGAGDLVAIVAQPIARAADAIFGTELANCSGCKRRQDALNNRFPIK